jgi:Tfp pilus assembly protein PilF
LAFLGLADYYLILAAGAGLLPAHEAMPAARGAAGRALEIDPSSPDAHAVLGAVAGLYDYDWPEAERQFRLALSSDPVSPSVRVRYGFFHLLPLGRPQQAIEELEHALQEDPLNTQTRVVSAACLLHAKEYEAASAECRRVLEIDQSNWMADAFLAYAHYHRGMPEEALAFAEKAYSPLIPATIGLFAGLLARNGNESRAEEVIARLKDVPESYGAPRGLVAFHYYSGEIDRAAEWLEKSIEQRDAMAPDYSRRYCRSSSRWPELAKLMKLPDVS